MNVQEYISGGIIESYVLGLATGEEKAEFERLCLQYPELVAARDAFEQDLERFAFRNAVTPSARVKVRFLEAMHEMSSLNQTKITNMEKATTPVRPGGFQRFMAAASVVLLLVCVYFFYHSSSQNAALKDMQDKYSDVISRLNIKDSLLNKIVDEQKHSISDPNVTVVNMVGTTAAPKSSANIYWDSASTSVFLVVKNMPRLPTDQQYQLWALINGKPSDLGVFDASNDKVILKMKNTQKAQAFAITIEKKGGSPSPTLDKMQSLGKLQQTQ